MSRRVRARRWWVLRAAGSNPLARRVDRVELFAALAAVLLLALTAQQLTGFADDVYADRAHVAAQQTATRHQIDAVVVGTSRPVGRGPASTPRGPTTSYSAPIRWFAAGVTRDGTTTANHALTSGDRVRIWIDDTGAASRAPLTAADARTDAVGAAVLCWIVIAGACAAAIAGLRRVLDVVRYRAWDRGWRDLVDGGGRATIDP